MFVNYRAGDGDWAATLIARELSTRFGAEHVFLASRSIRLGEDSVRTVHERLAGCDVVLTVIGPRWRESGDDDDEVHHELATALRRGLRVIPVFLDHLAPLSEAGLPADIAALARCQYLRLSHRNDTHDLARLVGELAALVPDLVLVRIIAAAGPADRQLLPSAWLRAEYHLVPFSGRESEYAELAAWAELPDPVSVRLVTGPAGRGKTRLALRLCREFAERGWVTGLVHGQASQADLARVGEIDSPLLLVVDDAQARVEQAQALAAALLTRATTAPRARLVLVSREAGDWLRGLHTLSDDRTAGLFRGLVEHPLAPLVPVLADRRAEFLRAASAYAEFLGLSEANVAPPADLAQSHYASVRVLHASALVALLRRHSSVDAVPPPDLELLRAARPDCPYRGLRPFQVQDAAVFHGRDQQVHQLKSELERHSLVMVIGASGSGKSSLVRAGLLPLLHRQDVALAAFRPAPGVRPAELLAHALKPILGTELTTGLTAETVALLAGSIVDTVGRLVLFVDQYEELVAADPDAARELLGLVAGLVHAAPPRPAEPPALRAVFTGRSANLEEVLTSELTPMLRMVAVPRMGPAELRAAVAGPEELPLASFEPGLVDRIIADAADAPGQLPMVEFALTRLWESRQGETLTHQAYDDQGGVAGALATYADEVYTQRLLPSEQQLVEPLLVQLARPDEHGAFTLAPARIDQLDADSRVLARKLAAHRLLVIRQDPSQPEVVALAHEALIQQWQHLHDWLVATRDFRSWQEQLRTAMTQWRNSAKDAEMLLRAAALATAEDWLATRPAGLTEPERDYIIASRAHRRRGLRRWRMITTLIGVLALLATGSAVIAVNRNQELADQLHRAAAVALGQVSDRRTETDPLAAMQFAQAAWRHDPTSGNAYAALLRQYLRYVDVDEIRKGLWSGPVATTAGTTDGQVVAVGEQDGKITLCTGLLGQAPQCRFVATVPNLYQLVVSPDGRWLAAVTDDVTITLWDIVHHHGPLNLRLAGPSREAKFVSARTARFTPDGNTLVVTLKEDTGAKASLVEVWDVVRRQPVAHGVRPAASLQDTYVRRVEPDGRSAWFGEHGHDRTRRNVLRDLATGSVLREVTADYVTPDGLLVECQGARLTVRDATTGAVRLARPVLDCPLPDVAELTDLSGRYAVFRRGAPEDSFQQLWLVDLHTGETYSLRDRPPSPRPRERQTPNLFALPNASATLAVFAFDTGALLRFRTVGPTGDLSPFTPSSEPSATTLSPDGRLLATLTDQGRLWVFESNTQRVIASNQEPLRLRPVPRLTFTDDGRHLLAIDQSGELVVLSVPEFTVRRRIAIPPPAGNVHDVSDAAISIIPIVGDEVVVLRDDAVSRWHIATGEPLDNAWDLNQKGYITARAGRQATATRWSTSPLEVLLTSSAGLEMWDLNRRDRVRSVQPRPGDPTPVVVVDPVRLRVAAHYATAGQLVLWHPERGDDPRIVPLPGDVSPVGFASDGKLITSSGTGELQMWELDARGRVATLRVPARPVGWSQHGDTLMVATGSGPHSIGLNPQQWFEQLCRINNRDYTPEERGLIPSGADPAPPCAAASPAHHTATPLRIPR